MISSPIKIHHIGRNLYKCQLSWINLEINMIIVILVLYRSNCGSVAKSVEQHRVIKRVIVETVIKHHPKVPPRDALGLGMPYSLQSKQEAKKYNKTLKQSCHFYSKTIFLTT